MARKYVCFWDEIVKRETVNPNSGFLKLSDAPCTGCNGEKYSAGLCRCYAPLLKSKKGENDKMLTFQYVKDNIRLTLRESGI